MQLYHGDCLKVMDELIEKGIKVDMILCDHLMVLLDVSGTL